MTDRTANGFASSSLRRVARARSNSPKRLAAALDALENAVERRREADRIDDDLGARIQALGADRSRLANELDGTLVRSRALERTNREIAERLDVAIDTIRSVIESGDQQP
jgi:hypothetical protein